MESGGTNQLIARYLLRTINLDQPRNRRQFKTLNVAALLSTPRGDCAASASERRDGVAWRAAPPRGKRASSQNGIDQRTFLRTIGALGTTGGSVSDAEPLSRRAQDRRYDGLML